MNRERPQFHVWWLNPFWVIVIPVVLFPLAAWMIPDADYQLYWRMPKVFTGDHLMLCLLVAAAFTMGCGLAMYVDAARLRHRRPKGQTPSMVPSWQGLLHLFHAGVCATAFAYALWFGLIMRQTGPGIFLSVLRGDEGSIYELIRLRKDAAVAGVSSFTQAGIATSMLGIFLAIKLGWQRVRWPLALLLALTLVRAVFLAERLALIEILLPTLVLWLRVRSVRRITHSREALVQVAPFAGALALYALFTFGEYFRSWSYYSGQGETSLLRFSFVRLLGYYVTSLNNGALLWDEVGAVYFPNATLGWLWRFPLLGGPLKRMLGGSDEFSDDISLIVSEDANPEFNNPTGIFVVFMDYGTVGALAFFVLFGFLATMAYQSFRRGSAAGLFLYPFIFMGLTDQVRTFYLSGGRTFVAWLFLFSSIIVLRRALKKAVSFTAPGSAQAGIAPAPCPSMPSRSPATTEASH